MWTGKLKIFTQFLLNKVAFSMQGQGSGKIKTCMFLFFPDSWPYILNASLFSSNSVNIFSILAHVFRN